ncbi:hypothetical protein X798_08147 [Onchocerca flexuosa]|uniref:Uncharacterized protein n=1 Tax=Onchocerca flexuosa TaxID=387005 RepID=A0A238BHB5_9BILA|nr:hypothetical protein X798_08147 [Onchocerca flexuosa]
MWYSRIPMYCLTSWHMVRVGVGTRILEKVLENRRIKKYPLIVSISRMYSEQSLTGFNRNKLEKFIRCCNCITCSRNVGNNDDSPEPRSEVLSSDNCKGTSIAGVQTSINHHEDERERECVFYKKRLGFLLSNF